MIRALATFLLALMIAGCDANPAKLSANIEGSAEQLFAQAEELKAARSYDLAAERYSEVERQYPLSPLAIQSQYERAVMLYRGQKYAQGALAFDRFLQFNPGHRLELSATYLRALCFYDEIPDVFRDQGVTKRAQEAFLDLIARFPNTTEAKDAREKLRLVRDQLAGHEMVVGRIYLTQSRYLAAQNRFKQVIEAYPTTAQVPEAFYRLVETSLALGLRQEARRYGATLGFNFPDNPWYHRAYALLGGTSI